MVIAVFDFFAFESFPFLDIDFELFFFFMLLPLPVAASAIEVMARRRSTKIVLLELAFMVAMLCCKNIFRIVHQIHPPHIQL
jgi:hypothetical protein